MSKKAAGQKKTKQEKTPENSVEKITKEFSFPLTEKETAELGKRNAFISLEVTQMTSAFKRAKKEYEAKLEAKLQETERNSVTIRDEKENRVVEVEMRKNFESKLVQYFYQGKLLEERTMTADELQMQLDLTKKPRAKGKKELTGAQKTYSKAKGAKDATHQNGKANNDIAGAIREETHRRTKKSAVDGCYGTA